jgi:hypothetical protein
MKNKNTIVFGLLIGFLLPLAGTILFYGIFELLESLDSMSDTGFRPMFRQRTASIVGIAMNAFLINHFSKQRYHQTVRGVVLSTTLLIILWLILFGKYIF